MNKINCEVVNKRLCFQVASLNDVFKFIAPFDHTVYVRLEDYLRMLYEAPILTLSNPSQIAHISEVLIETEMQQLGFSIKRLLGQAKSLYIVSKIVKEAKSHEA